MPDSVYRVDKASRFTVEPLNDAILYVGPGEPPKLAGDNARPRYTTYYKDQAQRIMDALQHLPGGTWHQLRILILEDYANILRVKE